MSPHAISLNHETLGTPENPCVLLIHGLFGDLDNLKSISRALSDAYYVINIDLRNHGQSPWVSSMSFPEMANDVLALLDKLNIEQTHVLGHSLGGKVAMEVAMHHPERVRSLVVADIAPVRYPPSHNTILSALTALPLDQVENRQDADARLSSDIKMKGVRQFLLKNLTKTDKGWAWRMNLADINACYPELIGAPGSNKVYEGPTLFIRGENSDYIQAEHRSEILSRFPHAQSKTMSGVGHWLHAEKPLIFNGLVERFLDEN